MAWFDAYRELRDVNEAVEPGLDFDEESEVCRADDAAGERRSRREALFDVRPWVGFEFLHRERNAFAFVLDLDHSHADFLSDLDELFRIGHAAARHLGDVQQTIDAAEVYECAERRERLHAAGERSEEHTSELQ